MADFIGGVIKGLTDGLATAGLTGLTIYREWPAANKEMALPALSLLTVAPRFTRCAPYVLSKTTPDVDNNAVVKWCVGQYDLSIQMDIWTAYKAQRNALYEAVFNFFQGQGDAGFNVALTEYHNAICGYQQTSYSLGDDEERSSREEWRARFTIEATCRAIVSKTEAIITEVPQLNFTIEDGDEFDTPASPVPIDGGGASTEDFDGSLDGGNAFGY